MTSLPLASSNPAESGKLPLRAVAILIVTGVVLWVLGVLLIRALIPTGAMANAWTPLIYLGLVLVSIPLTPALPRYAGVARSRVLECGAIVAATASLIDGVVVRWAPWIYADDARLAADSAASLLWAIGVAVALAYVMPPKLR
jgi:hypothetical protein